MVISVEIMAPDIHETIEGESNEILTKIRALQRAFEALRLDGLTINILYVSGRPPEGLEATPFHEFSPIEDLDFPIRPYNGLARVGIRTVGDLLTKKRKDLLKISNMGEKSVDEIEEILGSYGLKLAQE